MSKIPRHDKNYGSLKALSSLICGKGKKSRFFLFKADASAGFTCCSFIIYAHVDISGILFNTGPIRLKISVFFQKAVSDPIFLVTEHSSQINIFHAVEDIGFNVRIFFLHLSNQLFRLQTLG